MSVPGLAASKSSDERVVELPDILLESEKMVSITRVDRYEISIILQKRIQKKVPKIAAKFHLRTFVPNIKS
jgi:hypothetical protein